VNVDEDIGSSEEVATSLHPGTPEDDRILQEGELIGSAKHLTLSTHF
jgi:hypothetical protein